MENNIKAKVFNDFEDEYEFSHWISTAGNAISPNENTRIARITLESADTLIAVFEPILTSITNLDNELSFNVYPNPTKDYLILEYDLKNTTEVQVNLYSTLGNHIATFDQAGGTKTSGHHTARLPLENYQISGGMYILSLTTDKGNATKKVTIIE